MPNRFIKSLPQAEKPEAVYGTKKAKFSALVDEVVERHAAGQPVLVGTIAVETSVKLQTTSDKTVVIKQIMIDEPIVTWMYPITYTAGENGTIEGWTIAFPDEEVKVTSTPAEGYKTVSLTYNGIALHDEAVGYVTFIMPAEAVQVAAEFATDFPTGINNTEEALKAVKSFENGQLMIEKNGVKYNAQGTILK